MCVLHSQLISTEPHVRCPAGFPGSGHQIGQCRLEESAYSEKPEGKDGTPGHVEAEEGLQRRQRKSGWRESRKVGDSDVPESSADWSTVTNGQGANQGAEDFVRFVRLEGMHDRCQVKSWGEVGADLGSWRVSGDSTCELFFKTWLKN